jgi:hypothetical protein
LWLSLFLASNERSLQLMSMSNSDGFSEPIHPGGFR